ncbi:MAG: hypothetical protein ACKO7U_08930, partial [Actinomycetota bacterium]
MEDPQVRRGEAADTEQEVGSMASADDAERRVDLGATALAAEQEKRLVRTLTRLDTVFLIIAAVVALDVV